MLHGVVVFSEVVHACGVRWWCIEGGREGGARFALAAHEWCVKAMVTSGPVSVHMC